jgi:hypothetical protein
MNHHGKWRGRDDSIIISRHGARQGNDLLGQPFRDVIRALMAASEKVESWGSHRTCSPWL